MAWPRGLEPALVVSASIGRRFARWAANLLYEDLPPAVVEKVRSLVLQHLVGAVFGAERPRVRELVALVRAEDPMPGGAAILGDDLGPRVTRQGGVLANAEILNAARLNDSFRMITHPGPVLISVGLTNALLEGGTGRDLITALACGYEIECRLADDFVPTVSAHGFRPAPIFSTMGSAVVAAKLFGLDEDGTLAALGVAANAASGLNESRRDAVGGGNENSIHQANAARQGLFAAVMARSGRIRGSEKIIEGDAGFYAAYGGSREGRLSYVFSGPTTIDLGDLTAQMGTRYTMLKVMFRIWPVAGFDQPVIELMGDLRQRHDLDPAAIVEVEVEVNHLETLYPSPAFPRIADPATARVGSVQFFLAHVAVNGGYPVIGGSTYGPTGERLEEDERVLDFMRSKVRLVAAKDRPMFSPRITVRMADGTVHVGELAYERLMWSFPELVTRLQGCVPGLPGGQARLDRLVEVSRGLEELGSVEPLYEAVRLG